MLPVFARSGLRATAQQFAVPRTAALNAVRTYAAPAQEVKPPVALFGVSGTYATALVRFPFTLVLVLGLVVYGVGRGDDGWGGMPAPSLSVYPMSQGSVKTKKKFALN